MDRGWRRGALAGALSLWVATAAGAAELANDGWTPGGAATFETRFVQQQGAAVRLTGPGSTVRVDKVRFLFGPDPVEELLYVLVCDVNGQLPGDVLFAKAYFVTGSDALHEIDVSHESKLASVPSDFFLEIRFPSHDGLPSVAYDGDGLSAAERNLVFLPSEPQPYATSQAAGDVTGDWVIRADVTPVPEPAAAAAAPAACGALAALARRRKLPRR